MNFHLGFAPQGACLMLNALLRQGAFADHEKVDGSAFMSNDRRGL